MKTRFKVSRQGIRRRNGRGRQAFTLVEVLATISLIGVALPVMMEAVSVAIHCADMAHHRNEAAGLAESKLNEIVVTGAWENGSSLGGDFSPDWPNYQWTANVSEWTQSGLEQIDVHVTWHDRDGDRDVVASTLVYNNVNAGAGASASSTGSTSGTGSGSKGSGTAKSGSSSGSTGGTGGTK